MKLVVDFFGTQRFDQIRPNSVGKLRFMNQDLCECGHDECFGQERRIRQALMAVGFKSDEGFAFIDV